LAASTPDGSTRTPNFDVLRLVFAGIGLLALILGYLGLSRLEPGQRHVDLIYAALQLFVLEFAPTEPGPYPMILEIARFAAPVVTIYAFVEAGRLIFAAEVRRFRVWSAHGHVIVCGDTLLAATLARQVRAAGHRVVAVRSGGPESTGPVGPGPLRVIGDARDADVLRSAGIGRASALYACTGDSAANTAIALAARRLARAAGRPLSAYAQVSDPDLCLALQARYLGLPQPPGLRLDFFNVDDLAARTIFAEEPLRAIGGRPPRVLVIGGTAFGRAVVIEVARRWRRLDPDGADRLHLVLVDDDATRTVEQLAYRYPFLTRVCHLTPHEEDVSTLRAGRAFDRVFICYDDEELALKTALTSEWLWYGGGRSVVVRLDRLAALREAFGGASGDPLLDEMSGTLRLYGVVEGASDPAAIGDDLVERLARVIHDSYEAARRRHGDRPDTNLSMVAWEDLPETLQRANRAQAQDIGRKLRAVGCMLSPRVGPGVEYALGDGEVDRLAVMEHERWYAERVAAGWRYDDSRDDHRLLHPSLRDWSELPDDSRQKNYDAVRELPAILADAGFRIVRM
jgi:hypothetical protein